MRLTSAMPLSTPGGGNGTAPAADTTFSLHSSMIVLDSARSSWFPSSLMPGFHQCLQWRIHGYRDTVISSSSCGIVFPQWIPCRRSLLFLVPVSLALSTIYQKRKSGDTGRHQLFTFLTRGIQPVLIAGLNAFLCAAVCDEPADRVISQYYCWSKVRTGVAPLVANATLPRE